MCVRPARDLPSSAAGTWLGVAVHAAARLDRNPNPSFALHRAPLALPFSMPSDQRATHSISWRDRIARRGERRHAVPNPRLTPELLVSRSLRACSQVVHPQPAALACAALLSLSSHRSTVRRASVVADERCSTTQSPSTCSAAPHRLASPPSPPSSYCRAVPPPVRRGVICARSISCCVP